MKLKFSCHGTCHGSPWGSSLIIFCWYLFLVYFYCNKESNSYCFPSKLSFFLTSSIQIIKIMNPIRRTDNRVTRLVKSKKTLHFRNMYGCALIKELLWFRNQNSDLIEEPCPGRNQKKFLGFSGENRRFFPGNDDCLSFFSNKIHWVRICRRTSQLLLK